MNKDSAKKLLKLSKSLANLSLFSDANLIKSLVKSAVPLWEADSYSASPEVSSSRSERIGFNLGRDKKEIDIAKKLMANTKDNWVVISPDTDAKNIIDTKEFAKWLEGKRYPEGSYILLVDSKPADKDFTTAGWILHDVIGHSIDNYFVNSGMDSDELSSILGQTLINNLHKLLPPALQNATTTGDMLPDIYCGIIFGNLNESHGLEAIEKTKEELNYRKDKSLASEAQELSNMIFSIPQIWIDYLKSSSIQIGKNKVNIVEPW